MDMVKALPSQNPMEAQMDVSAIPRKHLDLAYGPKPEHKLDIYLPDEGEGPFPTIVFIHGGAFVGGAKRDNQFVHVLDGIRRGYAVASIDQRLLPAGVFPLAVFDVKAALRFLKKHGAEYGVDGNRLATAGDSAGAYHAVFAAATQDIPAFEGPEVYDADSRVRAAIGLFGVYDLAMQSQFSVDHPMPGGDASMVFNFADMFAGGDTRKNAALGYLTDCKTYVTKDMPYVMIETGDADQVVPYKASLELAQRIEERCGADRVRLDVYPGAMHGDPVFLSPVCQERIFSFLDAHVK